jgi:triosephosphate isomerase
MVAGVIKMNRSELMVLYGGSVKSVNVKGFTERSNIDGVLVGGASLDAQEFIKIIENA